MEPHTFRIKHVSSVQCNLKEKLAFHSEIQAVAYRQWKCTTHSVHYREHSQGKRLTKQCLAHWLCEAITQVYYMSQRGKTPCQALCPLYKSFVLLHSCGRHTDVRWHHSRHSVLLFGSIKVILFLGLIQYSFFHPVM